MKQYLAIALVLMFILPPHTFAADKQSPKDKLKTWEPGSKVQITLLDGQKVSGKLGAVSESTCVITNKDFGPEGSKKIAFNEIKQVKKPMSTGAKVAIITGATLGAVGILALVAVSHSV